MILRPRRLVPLLAALLLGGSGPAGLAEVFCNQASGQDDRFPLPSTTALPWGAVGYLDNGCTGTLIDPSHIVAAAHCFTWTDTGAWQRELYFVPNFSPAAPASFVHVDRVVVGSRARLQWTGPWWEDEARHDWGLGHLASPVTAFPSLAIEGAPSAPAVVQSAGYARDLARVQPSSRPPGAPCRNPFCQGGQNVWWDEGLVDPQCTIVRNVAGLLFHTCDTVGGNSGSPLLRQAGGTYRIAGVIFGGGSSVDRSTNVVTGCTPPGPATEYLLNLGPAAQTFVHAPLAAVAVAVAPVGGVAARGAAGPPSRVFVADSDADRVVARTRAGASLADPFAPFAPFASARSPAALTTIERPDGGFGLIVAPRSGPLLARDAGGAGDWHILDSPRGASGFRDVDAIDGAVGEIVAITNQGKAYRRLFTASGWGTWSKLPGSGWRRVAAALLDDGRRLVLLRSPRRIVRQFVQKGSTWEARFSRGSFLAEADDVDLTRDRFGVLRAFALRDDVVWTQEWRGRWPGWRDAAIRLYAPLAASEAAASADALASGYWRETTGPYMDGLASLTAAQWAEPGAADATVLLAVDGYGNVYFSEPRCRTDRAGASCPAGAHWSAWRSFYQ
ncbi:MAG: hypothetical protein IT201_04450 [Thermoleophilia bacterium]|nr:hypothetical protein [Thermoleophilia bacterium]